MATCRIAQWWASQFWREGCTFFVASQKLSTHVNLGNGVGDAFALSLIEGIPQLGVGQSWDDPMTMIPVNDIFLAIQINTPLAILILQFAYIHRAHRVFNHSPHFSDLPGPNNAYLNKLSWLRSKAALIIVVVGDEDLLLRSLHHCCEPIHQWVIVFDNCVITIPMTHIVSNNIK